MIRGAVSYKRALYVGDLAANDIKILSNTYYREIGVITNGISGPFGESMDRRGNLYVANEYAPSVTEYAPGATTPFFTYNASMQFPEAVTVDLHGNVFEADAHPKGDGYVNQYFQGVNTLSESCPSPAGHNYVTSVAVDKSGDVFLGTWPGSGAGGNYEYVGGLAGCNATFLTSITPSSMVLDSSNNLIIADYGTKAVEVLDPPYTQISRTIGSGFAYNASLSLNKKNKRVFLSDFGNKVVDVINYQTGQTVKVLDASYGITSAGGVVDGPNAVY
jgi:hypothetical protein